MANMTTLLSITVLCVILLSATNGNFYFWPEYRWRRSTTTHSTSVTAATAISSSASTAGVVTSISTSKSSSPPSSPPPTTAAAITTRGSSSSSSSSSTASIPPSSPSTAPPTSAPSSFTTFQNEALAQTNKYRAAHCAPNLVLSPSLNAVAQAYAEKLAATRTFTHSGSSYGENLWSTSSSQTMSATSISGSSPIDSWYSEVKQYSWASPGFSSSTGHFTQVVWISTTQFGIGIACSTDQKSCYVVANYSPPGNYQGQYPSNVKQGPTCA